jgi:PAS domain S-box-containing protein
MVFDIRTVLASYFITDLVSTLVILQLYFQSRKRIAGIIYWLFDILLQSIGLFLILSRSFIPVFYSIVISNFLILTGILLGLIGLERLLKIRRNHIFNYLLLVISVIVQIWFTYIQPDLAIRTLSFSILSFLLFIQCARLLLRNEKSSLLKLTRPVGYIFIGYCIISSIRIIDFFVTVHPSNDFFHSSEFEAFMLFLFQILTILLVYNLSLFFNRWLLLDIKFEEEKFSKAFYSSPYAITLTKFPGGEIIEVNHGFVKITGYEAEEVVGKMVTDLHLWSKVEERVEILSELNSTGKVFDREVKFFKKNGDIINGLFSAEVIDIKDGKFVISTINDITKQKNINKALKDSEKQLRSFFENSMDAIMLTSADGRILTANPAACEMFGYTEGELIEAGKDGIVDKTDPNLKKLLDERQRIGKAKGEIRMIHKNGTVFPAEISSAIFNNNAGERRASIIIRNISDRKKA